MPFILNADDFGLTQGVNDAVFELAALGTLSSTTVMVNMPYAEAARNLIKITELGVGLHFNLTEGRPVSGLNTVPTLVNVQGAFYEYSTFRKRLGQGKIKRSEILVELHNQFERLSCILGCNPTHLDSHQNIHKISTIARAFLEFGKHSPELAVRAPARFIWRQRENRIVPSFSLSLRNGRFVRAFKEVYLHRLTSQLRQSFRSPKGELHYENFKKLDLLKLFAERTFPENLNSSIFEIACHPATSVQGLGDSKLKEQRLQEFAVLSSEGARRIFQSLALHTFADL